MHWQEILINLAISVVGGIFSGLVVFWACNILIDRKIKNREEYKNKLLVSLLFFQKLENGINKYSPDYINEKLVEYRHLYEKDTELKNAFYSVDVDLSNTIRLMQNGACVSYEFNSEIFLKFENLLERRIKT